MLLAEAVRAGIEVGNVFAEPEADAEVLSLVGSAGAEVCPVPSGSLAKALDLVTPQAVVGVATQPHHEAGELMGLSARRERPVLVLVALQDPGNAGTLVRVAEAADCVGVVLSRGSVDLWNPKTVRAAAGALFRLPVAQGIEIPDVLALAADAGLRIVAGAGVGGAAPERVDLGGSAAVFVGAESHGLPKEVLEASDDLVSVPMAGEVESLNAAVAGAVLAFEGARQRRCDAGGRA